MTWILDSDVGRHVVVPAEGPVGGDAVGVAEDVRPRYGLLIAGNQRHAVTLSALREVPRGVLAIGDDLAEQAGFGNETRWRLEKADPVDLVRLQLELPTEKSVEGAARALGDAGLAGRVLWVPQPPEECWLEVDGVPHRVRALDSGGRTDVLARITERTVVEVFAPGVRGGVDIVILADTSGSMSIDDIVSPEGHYRRVTRMAALQQALIDLLEVRLRIDGRLSRVALAEFNHELRVSFPRGGGMAELDGSAPASVVNDFRTAVALLQPKRAGTDIGNALHEAAQLLYLHGVPDNDKLIVLVSDGAHWQPKGEQGTGEVVQAVQEPVSLMAHLHQNTGLRLHTIGISTQDMYRHWLTQTRQQSHPTSEPNHALLAHLVAVGGGDPSTIGGLDVLAGYFSGLGAGVSCGVRVGQGRRRSGGLSREAVRLLSAGNAHDQGRRAKLGADLAELAGRCNEHLVRVFGDSARLDYLQIDTTINRSILGDRSDERAFTELVRGLRCFRPRALPADVSGGLVAAHGRLCGFLDDLQRLGRNSPDYAEVGRLTGERLTGPGEAIVATVELLRTLLGQFAETLAEETRAATPAPAPQRFDVNGPTDTGDTTQDGPPPPPTFRFVE
ncbi:VWA domain-containing protein [Streptosporangium algeriense]|uniref:VWA domain-containing protein n=1 Tax=Streptosporangium algeriense TaxID=1682748 RepID=A0ABW3DSF4_9ACTN